MKKKKKLRQIFFSFSPFGTYSVSFWLCIALPVYLLSFFLVFSFGNNFLRIFYGYMQSLRDRVFLFVLYRLAVTSFSWRICGARKRSKKNTAFSIGFLISNDKACPYGSGSSTFLPFSVRGRISALCK